MSSKTDARLAPRERLARGLKYSAVGPVDVTRGVLGLGVDSAQSTTATLRRQYRKSRLRREIAAAQSAIAGELAAAQEVVVNLPQVLQDVRTPPQRRRRPLVVAAVAAAVLAGGAVAFSVVRRNNKPQPSPLPPSVEVTPRP
ncbi:cell wall synthesis protein CwsA [Mycolicibacterium arseniciresistens]|uniref:Cell wall synthesis protein CwsA n=1 Tax=Mycolicibacterium arseniciresistens TaxID=3062257 RepID=A0ABT8UP18_9MYCO|nr:cell wall synthesis protein CwsA [Mycolicibacterium arseniciresistens]MDO3639533.1 cell wall synthesis protein CwsA [Mycolicibacterium arseniciresistens]